MEVSKEKVSTAVQDKIQPWQALFAILTYALTQFDIGEANTIILLGMILAALGFVQRSTYKHKEAVKDIVAPWLVEKLLKEISEYLEPHLPITPEEDPEPIVDEPTREELLARLEELGHKE